MKSIKKTSSGYIVKHFKIGTNFAVLWGNLHNDLIHIKNSELYKSDVGQRIYIKSVVSLMEGVSYLLRQHMIKDKSLNLTPYEEILLAEISIELNESGEVKLKSKQYSAIQMFKFTFKTYAKHYEKSSVISEEFSDVGFSKLQSVVKKRNFLTHPKKSKDFELSESDIEDALISHDWLHSFFIKAFDKVFIETIS